MGKSFSHFLHSTLNCGLFSDVDAGEDECAFIYRAIV